MSHYCPVCSQQHNGLQDECNECLDYIQNEQAKAQAQAEGEAQAYEQYQADQAQQEQGEPGAHG